MSIPRTHLAFALAFALAGTSLADEKDYANLSLREIRNNATSFKSTRVAFKCRLNKTENLYAPFYTPFTPDRYLQISVWGPESRIWREKDRLDIFPNLFARKDSKWLAELLETHRYSWIYVWGEVVNDFNDMPWIEVHDFELLSEKHLTDTTLGAFIRAWDAYEKGDNKAVCMELSPRRFSSYVLPRTDRFHVVKLRAQAAWAIGEDELARTSAVIGLRIRPRDADLNAIVEGVAPRALPDEAAPEGAKDGDAEKKEGEGEGEKKEGGSIESMRDRVARLERENEKLRLELEAAREELANGETEPKKVAGETDEAE